MLPLFPVRKIHRMSWNSVLILMNTMYSHLKPVLRAVPMLFEPIQFQTVLGPNIYATLDAVIYSNAEETNFWNRVSFTKHSDNNHKLLRKTISYDFFITSQQNPTNLISTLDRSRFIPYNVLRVCLQDPLLNIAPLLALD